MKLKFHPLETIGFGIESGDYIR